MTLFKISIPGRYREALVHVRSSFSAKRWQWLIGILAFLLVNSYIVYRLSHEWHTLESFDWTQVDWRYLVFAALVQFTGLLIAIAIWAFIMRQSGVDLPFRRHFKIYTLGNLARKLPGGLGVDLLSRIYWYDHDGADKATVSFVTLVEPIILGISAIIVLLSTLVFTSTMLTEINVVIPVLVLIFFLILLPTPLFRRLLVRVSHVPDGQQALDWKHILRWIAVNTFTITLGGVTLFFFCQAFHVVPTAPLTLVQYWAMIVVSGMFLVWLPIDIGAANSLTIVLLANLMPMPQAVFILVVWRFWNTLNEMLWGALGFMV